MAHPKLALIDGHAVAYRAFHALQDASLRTSDGEPTYAVFGFFQIVLNLVSNAYEAMRHASPAKSIGVTTVHGYDDTVQLVVSDTGPGIPADRLEKIFDPFFTTKENGLGLGLSICRKIARAHGGTLLADSREGEGAIFRLVLPRADARERAAAAERR